jgi:hypothetical protein
MHELPYHLSRKQHYHHSVRLCVKIRRLNELKMNQKIVYRILLYQSMRRCVRADFEGGSNKKTQTLSSPGDF